MRYAILLVCISLLFVFQNCGKAGFDSGNDITSSKIDPSASTPFAYEASIDMISYNSCNSANSQGKTFTFKMGSYDYVSKSQGSQVIKVPKSGVRLSKNFVDYAYTVLKPDYPNPEITREQVQQLLRESELNNLVQPQFSIRSIFRNNRLGNVFFKSGSPSFGIDIIQVLGDLSDPKWSDQLLNKGFPRKSEIDFSSYFSDGSDNKKNIEASFHFNTNEQTAESYRNAFNKVGDLDAQIVMGFSKTNESALLTPDALESDVLSTAYGKGYQLTFQIPVISSASPTSWPYHPNNQVARVDEYDLTTGKSIGGAGWDCGVKFKIIRAEDAVFEWSRISATIDQAVDADATIPAASKPTQKLQQKINLASYYGYYYYNSSIGGYALNINLSTGLPVDPSVTTAGLCPKMNYNTLNTFPNQNGIYGTGIYKGKTYAQILEIVRRHLSVNEWDVNLEYGCVVPKRFGCYPDDSRKLTDGGTYYGKFRVSYQPNLACFHKFDPSYFKANQPIVPGGSLPLDYCTEFVTMCTKVN